MEGVFFSVIIPTLNEEKFLPRLLESLVVQGYREFEVIICDGNSKDKTVKLAKTFASKLPHLTIKIVDNPSLPKQRNVGAAVAKGEWLLFIDADSILHPYALERMKFFIDQEKPTHFSPWFSPDSTVVSDALLTIIFNGALETAVTMKRPVAFGSFSAMTKDIFEKIHGYNEELGWGEDNDISRRIYEAGHIIKIQKETLVVYSLRRFRKQGSLKTMQFYARIAFQVLLTGKSPSNIPSYVMGGHLYSKKDMKPKKPSKSSLRQFRTKLRKLMTELFS